MILRRGEIWWVGLDPAHGSEIAKTRPCVVLGRDTVNEHRRTVVVVPLSTAPRAYPPLGVAVNCAGGASVAVIDQIRAVTKHRFKSRIAMATQDELKDIGRALREVLGLEQ